MLVITILLKSVVLLTMSIACLLNYRIADNVTGVLKVCLSLLCNRHRKGHSQGVVILLEKVKWE